MTGPLTFEQACAYLFPRTSRAPGRDWSLGPTRRLLATLGHPEAHFPAVHIGGTNGKGSVAVMVTEILRAAGYRVGLFTSPHLVDVRERFLVDGTAISREAFATWTTVLRPVTDEADASFFEVTTAIACADFAARGVDLAVLEVGLGGRLDSTNVIDPLVAAVTNVGLEHTEYLGSTLETIAREKAGIAKRGVPFVVGETDPAVAAILVTAAEAAGAVPAVLAPDARYPGPLALEGIHQQRNAAVAAAIVERLRPRFPVGPDARRAGLAAARLPGRLDRRGRWLFDVAHNPVGLETLLDHLARVPPPRPVQALFGVQSDKAGPEMLRRLTEACDRIWVTTPPSVPPGRRTDVSTLTRGAGSAVTPEPDFDRALQAVGTGAGTALVTGSFHTVGDAMARLPGFQPLG